MQFRLHFFVDKNSKLKQVYSDSAYNRWHDRWNRTLYGWTIILLRLCVCLVVSACGGYHTNESKLSDIGVVLSLALTASSLCMIICYLVISFYAQLREKMRIKFVYFFSSISSSMFSVAWMRRNEHEMKIPGDLCINTRMWIIICFCCFFCLFYISKLRSRWWTLHTILMCDERANQHNSFAISWWVWVCSVSISFCFCRCYSLLLVCVYCYSKRLFFFIGF